MDNRPTGRKRNVSGSSSGVSRRGSGLGTGRVGRTDYSGKRTTGSSGQPSGTPFSSNTTGTPTHSATRAGLNP